MMIKLMTSDKFVNTRNIETVGEVVNPGRLYSYTICFVSGLEITEKFSTEEEAVAVRKNFLIKFN